MVFPYLANMSNITKTKLIKAVNKNLKVSQLNGTEWKMENRTHSFRGTILALQLI